MNQILYTGGKKKTSTDIKLIIKIFAIIIIIFGLFITSNASYTLYKNVTQNSDDVAQKPVINVEKIDDMSILISVSSSKKIDNFTYQWNDEEPIIINGNESTSLSEEVKVPKGRNMLKINAIDVKGQSISYENEYIGGSIPDIKLSVDGTSLKAKITSDDGLSYVTYRWDEEDETRLDIEGEKQSEVTIEIPQGLHTLTVIAVDVNNITETKKQDVNGVTRPILEITTDGKSFIVKATDSEQLEKLEYTLNGEENSMELSGKEFNYSIPLSDGENKLIITVYNSNDLSVEKKVKASKIE